MKLRHLAVLVLAILVAGFVLIAVLKKSQLDRRRLDQTPVATGSGPTAVPTSLDGAATGDRQRRAELRKKILEAWAQGERGEAVAEEAKRGRFEEHPDASGNGIDPKYIQATMRQDLFPMVRSCYEDLLSRQPDAGGTVDMWFKIVADDKLGGIVEEDDEHDGGTIGGSIVDDRMTTCVRESLLTLTFPPPAKGGVITVGYPIVFNPSSDEDGGK